MANASKGKWNKCSECHHFQHSHRLASAGGCQVCRCRRYHGPLEKAQKTTTTAYRDWLAPVNPESMCWEASLGAFGIIVPHDEGFRRPTWLIGEMESHGWHVTEKRPNEVVPAASDGDRITLAVLMPHVSTGSWLLVTRDHVIAVRDGAITDTMGTVQSVKRVVLMAYEVKTGNVNAPAVCACYDPVVFGHAPGHRQPVGMYGQL